MLSRLRSVLVSTFLALLAFGMAGCSTTRAIAYGRDGSVHRADPVATGAALLTWGPNSRLVDLEAAPDGTPVSATTIYYVNMAPPSSSPPSPRDRVPKRDELAVFDPVAARAAMSSVDVSACAVASSTSGFGHANVTFSPDGRITKVVIDEPTGMSDEAASCVSERLGAVKVEPFKGSLVKMGTTFHLPRAR